LDLITLAEFDAKQFGLRLGHTKVHALLAGFVVERGDFLQGRRTIQNGNRLLAEEWVIKPDNSLNRKIGSTKAGEHEMVCYSQKLMCCNGLTQFRKPLSKNIGNWSLAIGHCLFLSVIPLVTHHYSLVTDLMSASLPQMWRGTAFDGA
jgi:hypothetical protein